MTVLDILNVCTAKADTDNLNKPFRTYFTFTKAFKTSNQAFKGFSSSFIFFINQTCLFLKASFNQFKLVASCGMAMDPRSVFTI